MSTEKTFNVSYSDAILGPIMENKQLLDEIIVAAKLRVSRSLLRKWRMHKKGPPFFRLEGGCIRYRLEDLDAWIGAQKHEYQEYSR